jgi:hypothetical protein
MAADEEDSGAPPGEGAEATQDDIASGKYGKGSSDKADSQATSRAGRRAQGGDADGSTQKGEGGGGREGGGRGVGEGGVQVEWVGAKYSRERLLELSKSPAALRRPADLPLHFCKDEPGNLTERCKNERAARRKDEREKEKERKEGKAGKGGREPREGEFMGRGDFGRELARVGGGSGGSGPSSPAPPSPLPSPPSPTKSALPLSEGRAAHPNTRRVARSDTRIQIHARTHTHTFKFAQSSHRRRRSRRSYECGRSP